MASANKADGAVKLLLKAGANIEATDEDGDTPLHVASANEADGAVKLLLEAGANIEATNKDGKTARDLAENAGYDEVVQLLDGAAWLTGTGVVASFKAQYGETALDVGITEVARLLDGATRLAGSGVVASFKASADKAEGQGLPLPIRRLPLSFVAGVMPLETAASLVAWVEGFSAGMIVMNRILNKDCAAVIWSFVVPSAPARAMLRELMPLLRERASSSTSSTPSTSSASASSAASSSSDSSSSSSSPKKARV